MKKRTRTKLIVGLVAGGIVLLSLVVFLAISAARAVVRSGITKGPDRMFGDQHLKTAVALIELHKVRYGKYPATLEELKFTGQWDTMALMSVRYYANKDGTAYFVEVRRGWVGKPDLEMPDEFWQGTGYDGDLEPPEGQELEQRQ